MKERTCLPKRIISLPKFSPHWSTEHLVVSEVSFANEAEYYSGHNAAFNVKWRSVMSVDSARALVDILLTLNQGDKKVADDKFKEAEATHGNLLPSYTHVFTNRVFSVEQVNGQSVLNCNGKPVLTYENMHSVAAETLRELEHTEEFQDILSKPRKHMCATIIKDCLLPLLASRYSYYRVKSFYDYLVPPRAQPQAQASQSQASTMAHGNGDNSQALVGAHQH